MLKYFDLLGTDKKFKICSSIALNKTQGHIFIEAFQKDEVLKAVTGFNSIPVPKIQLIQTSEIQSILTPDPTEEITY